MVTMMYFSVPADFKKETIDKYYQLNQTHKNHRVIETYGNITSGYFLGSGRSLDSLPGIDFFQLRDYIKYSKKKNIEFNYTVNPSHMGNKEFTRKGAQDMVHFLEELSGIGVRCLTIALPSLFEIVKSLGFEFEIKASVICQITNVDKALAYKQMGAKKIVVDESVVRDFETLRRIRKTFGSGVELIANAICHKNCIYRMFHYNQISTDSVKVPGQASPNYYVHRCLLQRHKESYNLLKLGWIRPEDLDYYSGIGINNFKLQGRDNILHGNPAKAVECYFNESFDGNLMQLLDLFDSRTHLKAYLDNKKLQGFIKPFYENEHFCKNDCTTCNYCEKFAKKCIDPEKTRDIYQAADHFYSECDPFNRMIRSFTPGNEDERKKAQMKIETSTPDFNLDQGTEKDRE